MKYVSTLAGFAALGMMLSLTAFAVEEGGLIDSMRGDHSLAETNSGNTIAHPVRVIMCNNRR